MFSPFAILDTFEYIHITLQDARTILSKSTVLKRCHPRPGREAAVGDPVSNQVFTGPPTAASRPGQG